MEVVVLGVPLDLGAKNLGVDVGPSAFRYQQVVEKLRGALISVEDLGDIYCNDRKRIDVSNPKLKYIDEIVRVSNEAAKKVRSSVLKKKKIVGFGGDHSITLGLFSGVSDAVAGNVGMIYFDAHGDMNTEQTTMTGNIHGMHLASLLGFGDKRLVNIYKDGVKLKKENLIHIGGCDFDQAELDLAKREDLKLFQIEDMLTKGMGPLFSMIDDLRRRVNNLYVSIDLDSIDSLYAPGAGMPNRGGLTYREVVSLANYIGRNCNVIGVDVVEYNPLEDEGHKTAELGIELIARFFGRNYSWYSNYLEKNKL
jgi:arginase